MIKGNLPKVWVLMSTYNGMDYIEEQIESILSQTNCDVHLLVRDDGSTDESGKICDQYSEIDSRIHVIHKKNGGLSDARNVGLDYAVGEYIFFRRQ